jgi:hypothetical protein
MQVAVFEQVISALSAAVSLSQGYFHYGKTVTVPQAGCDPSWLGISHPKRRITVLTKRVVTVVITDSASFWPVKDI